MLISLLYVSQASGPVTTTITSSILESSSINNQSAGISGILCQGEGLYMQVLEGERSGVNALFSRIAADPRHHRVEILSLQEISERKYGAWSMAMVYLSKSDPMVQMRHPEFDPYSATAKDALALMDELVQTASPIGGIRFA